MKKLDYIKICGISTPDALDAAIDGGATHAGFIFFEKSPRHISLETAQKLSAHAGSRIAKVAVTVDATDEYLDRIQQAVGPDMFQLHGNESAARVAQVKERFSRPVMKAISVNNRDDVQKIEPYVGIADLFLFDSKSPEGSDLPGGNGVAFEWEIMDQLSKDVPYMLSGGLNIDNIDTALEKTGAAGVDVSSGVESSPGIKDLGKIRDFLSHLHNRNERDQKA